MKNYFVIHALGNTSKDYWYQFIKHYVNKLGYDCYTPDLPPIENMSYETWSKEFDKYAKYINKDSVFVCHSTGSIFIVKYLMEHNLKVNKFIGVVSFNECNTNSPHPDWEEINKTFFVDDLKNLCHLQKKEFVFILQLTYTILSYLINLPHKLKPISKLYKMLDILQQQRAMVKNLKKF